ncbi:MAG: 30S ribosomal protein S8 [Acidobacteriota bacterium]
MSMTDPIADMLTRMRNGLQAGQRSVRAPHSRVKEAIAQILLREGYLEQSHVEEKDGKRTLVLSFRSDAVGSSVLTSLQRVSKPGCRVYAGKDEVPEVLGGLGISIISTSKGLMTGDDSRKAGIGGEVMCSIW